MSPVIQSERSSSTVLPLAAIVLVSLLIIGFLSWLIYAHHAPAGFSSRLTFLPTLDAVLNGLCTACLLAGFYFIRRRRITAHRNSMIGAFLFSLLFLVSYIANHALHGDMRFHGAGIIKTLYLAILASHIVISAIALPLILITFYLALSGRFARHRAVARFTLPIWLYVSVTGVVVYLMLAGWQ